MKNGKHMACRFFLLHSRPELAKAFCTSTVLICLGAAMSATAVENLMRCRARAAKFYPVKHT
jgi:hypothetical protein